MADTKKPARRKRCATGTKGTKVSKTKAPVMETVLVEESALDVSVTETPAAEVSAAEESKVEEPVTEVPLTEEAKAGDSVTDSPAAEAPATEPLTAEARTEEEIRKAEKLLRANGYLLIPYGKFGRGIGRFFGAGVGFVKDACKGLCGWIAKKHAAMKVRREERRKADAERNLLEEEATRRAEIAKTEKRLAELRAEEARIKAGSVSSAVEQPPAEPVVEQPVPESVDQPVPEPVEQPESEPTVQPAAEKAEAAMVAPPDDSGFPKCATCGAELVPGARFCRKCGKPIVAPAPSM